MSSSVLFGQADSLGRFGWISLANLDLEAQVAEAIIDSDTHDDRQCHKSIGPRGSQVSSLVLAFRLQNSNHTVYRTARPL
jgi:hypothetical protein